MEVLEIPLRLRIGRYEDELKATQHQRDRKHHQEHMALTEAAICGLDPVETSSKDEPESTVSIDPTNASPSFNREDSHLDPSWRGPASRLSRYKYDVKFRMINLYRTGPEDIAIIRRDELLIGRHDEPVRKDRAPLPQDIEYWKTKEQYFLDEYIRIQTKFKAAKPPVPNMIGPKRDRIMGWMPEPHSKIIVYGMSMRRKVLLLLHRRSRRYTLLQCAARGRAIRGRERGRAGAGDETHMEETRSLRNARDQLCAL